MINTRIYRFVAMLVMIVNTFITMAQQQLTVIADKPVAAVSPTMWGIFFEDINFAADGGLYAELVKNRSFEFYNPLMGWKEIHPQGSTGKLLIVNRGNLHTENLRYANITISNNDVGYGLTNEGFRGMGFEQGKVYIFSFMARCNGGRITSRIALASSGGGVIAAASVRVISPTHEGTVPGPSLWNGWEKYTVEVKALTTTPQGNLTIYFEGNGSIDIDNISLFPKDTWKNRPGGLRTDLVQMLADLKPGFLRFPGGCIVEGHELDTRYQWKKTIGFPEDRTLNINRWNTEMKGRQAPDYFQSYGLGFYEYFQLAEDLGAAPLPILNCGMACQYNTAEVAPIGQMNPFIQDALDLVEFANGSSATKWGKLRTEMGHPTSFNLTMIGIGNEQWDEQYLDRYNIFEKAFHDKYPAIKLVAAAGPSPEGGRFEYAWREFKKLNPAFMDEHYYKPPQWFLDNANRYDNYSRSGPKIFAGEYAAHSKEDKEPESKNTWISALSEAAFMTGLERNADVVQMASYAPLFAHVDAWQWRPDLIWFDNLHCVGTPNYYVQKMFSNNKGTNVVPILRDGLVIEGKDSLYASAVIDKNNRQIIVKMVNSSGKPGIYTINIQGTAVKGAKAQLEVLSSDDALAYNTLQVQKKIFPLTWMVDVNKNIISVALSPSSLNVLRVSY